MQKKPVRKLVIKQLSSLKMAVVVILSLAAVIAWGTFVEARYDSSIAQKLVYHSIWMTLVMGTLVLNLLAVMLDRWPWQAKHTGFVCAHIGIIVLIGGSLVTQYYGVDGSISFGIGERSRKIVVSDQDFVVYSLPPSSSPVKLYDYRGATGNEVDFYMHCPQKEPVHIVLPDATIDVVDFLPFAIRDDKIVASDSDDDGPAVRFQLSNANVNMTDWVGGQGSSREAVKDLGPAQIILSKENPDMRGKFAVVLNPIDGEKLKYTIYSKSDPKNIKHGVASAGDVLDLGWMGMKFRIFKFMVHAKEETKFQALDRPTPLTTQALKVVFRESTGQGKPIEHWIQLNAPIRLFTGNSAYAIAFSNRAIQLDFDLQLTNFSVGRYPGTNRAASYESVVTLEEKGSRRADALHPISKVGPQIVPNIKISMNEPLKYGGFTFYQSSFQEDESGRPIMSILSVNRDPGRWIKYLGALIIVFGIIHLFYYKTFKKSFKSSSSESK